MKLPARIAAAVGLLLIVVGVFLGVSSVKVDGPPANSDAVLAAASGGNLSSLDCGSGFSAKPVDTTALILNGGNADARTYSARCESAQSTRQTITWLLIGAGVVVLAGSVVWLSRKRVVAPVA